LRLFNSAVRPCAPKSTTRTRENWTKGFVSIKSSSEFFLISCRPLILTSNSRHTLLLFPYILLLSWPSYSSTTPSNLVSSNSNGNFFLFFTVKKRQNIYTHVLPHIYTYTCAVILATRRSMEYTFNTLVLIEYTLVRRLSLAIPAHWVQTICPNAMGENGRARTNDWIPC
jgi:hypothetical protein